LRIEDSAQPKAASLGSCVENDAYIEWWRDALKVTQAILRSEYPVGTYLGSLRLKISGSRLKIVSPKSGSLHLGSA